MVPLSKLGGATKVTPAGGFVDPRLQKLFKYTPLNNTISTATPSNSASPSTTSNNAVKIAVPIAVIFALLGALLTGFCLYKKRRQRIHEAEANAAAFELPPHRENNEQLEFYGELASPQKYDPTKMGELESNYPPAYELPVMDPGNKRDSDVNQSPVVGVDGGDGVDDVGVVASGERTDMRETHEVNNDNHGGYSRRVAGVGEVRDSERGYNA